ncbi:O-methyltransferase [Flavihumibacter rivuli]|uniref:O-methyltransferase n=1 Tax=Flavihumibacter rivuli TaxID=2838156 RepID=UPI001BDE3272|nr:O-methyltransferase [Flavihumibacter rivuli]ULQ58285.1 O-methyltransferase [Flavihumibacter rivuli]
MDFILPRANEYAEAFTDTDRPLLAGIEERTQREHPQAHMLSGRVQGRFLAMVSRLMQPRFILEIGTFTGYSALCLAEGLVDGGQLHTIEIREADAERSRQNFSLSPKANQVILHLGDARSILPRLEPIWDLVFIDADKVGYIDYYELVLPRLRKGGLIIADNVLFHGQVLEEEVKGKNAKAIQAFNDHVRKDERVSKVLLTVRDGLLLIQKN